MTAPIILNQGDFRKDHQKWGGVRVWSVPTVSDLSTLQHLRAESLIFPYTAAWDYRGLIAIGFSEPIRAVCTDPSDCYLIGRSGGADVALSFEPITNRAGISISLGRLEKKSLLEKGSSMITSSYALCRPHEKEKLHLVDFDFYVPEDQDRFSGTNFGIPDHSGIT